MLIPTSTVRYRLVNKMTYKLKHCKWVPHRLSEAQKQTGVATSKRLLDLLGSIQHHGWKYLVTLDEAWFYFSNQHKQIWIPDQEDPPTIQRQMISSPKTMLTVVWNPCGIHVDSTWYLFCRKDRSGPANITLITFFPKYVLFIMQEIVGN
jgi:hypothetical protein